MLLVLVLFDTIKAQFQTQGYNGFSYAPASVSAQYSSTSPIYSSASFSLAQPLVSSALLPPVKTGTVASWTSPTLFSSFASTASVPASLATSATKDAEKAAAAAEKKRKDQFEAQQSIIDAQITNRARNLDVFAAGNLINGILTNPLIADNTIGVSGFGGSNGKLIRAGGQLARMNSRRSIANAYQRQVDRYIVAHPEPTKTDIDTVAQFRAKRDESSFLGDWARTNAFASLVPSSNKPLANSLTAVNLAQFDEGYQSAALASRHALALARDKYLKNTSDVSARQIYFQARDFQAAKNFEQDGTSAERLNAVLPLIGATKNPFLTQYGVLSQQKGVLGEKNIAKRQLKIAQQNMDQNPSEDNWLKLKLARATFDWRDSYEQFYRSRSLGGVATAALPSLWRNIFSASSTLGFKDAVDAQKRISRITLQIRQRDYAKKYEGADQTEQRMLALNSYGKSSTQGSSSDSKSAASPQSPAVEKENP